MTVVLVTVVMASGTSTVAERAGPDFPARRARARRTRAAQVRGDVFRWCVVAGRPDPTPPRVPLLRSRTSSWGPVLADVVGMFSTEPLKVVVLDPDADVVATRESQRARTGTAIPSWLPQARVR